MGGNQSSKIPKKSPLGCILAHWKDIGGPPGGSVNKKTLYVFVRKERMWDEVMYADMFSTLRNHPEWQVDCGINIPPEDALVLSLEKEK